MTSPEHPRVADLRNVRDQARRELEAFRDSVRAEAIEAHRDNQWDREALNGALAELGLALYEPRCTAEITIPVVVDLVDTTEDDAWPCARRLAGRLQPAVREAIDQLDLPYEAEPQTPRLNSVIDISD